MPFSDARDYQIAILTTFLLLGVYTRDWTLNLTWVLLAIATCILTQWSFSAWQAYRCRQETPLQWSPLLISGARSAAITGLGLSLLLRVNHPLVLVGAAVGAIASKFLFRYQEKHFFNPANFGIIMALLWTDGAWVSPGQWGTDWWYLLLFFSAAGLVLNRVGRWDTSIAFLGSYGGLEILRNFWLGWSWDVVAHQLTSGSLLLFAFFMLTDPRSIPNGKQGRIFWAISIALLTFVLQHGLYTSTAIFWALFCLAPSTIVIDKIWRSSRFQWQEKAQVKAPIGDSSLTLQTRPVI
ncbi:Na+-transporting NADH:ubiquinone oxidoreductase, subunit NqrB [Picosynechococcus sp. PCC 11901]|uniref:RnfABCDGE type electron transport complex subunit D n=1 Tax=Picosynechococcus sp. PCC 11901 TaxID=2579791 RepID=UPI0010FBF510|nr:RnfABCDGE type electron transport complex subunit D [Picosynechococcus sp. PCC 11901]QCS49986.1 Na+-transporting NADH:ubiquinone oxidoreductase, subunit NqrB [Picosynechococcus sp. PCC 11901]